MYSLLKSLPNLVSHVSVNMLVDMPIPRVVTYKVVDVGVINVTGWKNRNICSEWKKCLHFTRERDRVYIIPRIKEWANTDRIARRHDTLTIGVYKGKITIDKFCRLLDTVRLNHGDDDFTVTRTLLVSKTKISMIVNFTITYEHGFVPHEWLHSSTREVIDRETVKVHSTFS